MRFADEVTDGTYISDGSLSGTHLLPISFFDGGATHGFGDFVIGKCVDSERLCSSNGRGETERISPLGNFSHSFSSSFGSLGASSIGQYLIDIDNQLWLTDGTRAGTKVVIQHTDEFTLLIEGVEGQRVYYSVYNLDDFKLWHSDGTREGTYPLQIQFEDADFSPLVLLNILYLLLMD